jgi:hypothetical protein
MADTPTKTLADGTVVYNVGPGKYSRQAPSAPSGGGMTDMGGQGPAPSQRRYVTEDQLASNNAGGLALKDLGEGFVDAAQGAVSGLASGWDDEVLGENYTKAKQHRLGRSAARSAQAEQDLDAVHPALGYVVPTDAASAGEVGGSIAQGVAGGAALKGAGLVAKAGQAATKGQKIASLAGSNVAQGAVAGAGNAEEGMGLEGALVGGAAGGIMGGIAKGVGKGYARMTSGEAARAAQVGADEARVQAAGMSVAEAQANPGGVARQAASQRELGLGEGVLTSKSEMRDQAGQALERLGEERGGIEGRLSNEVTSGNNVAQRLRRAKARLPEFGNGSELRDKLEAEAFEASRQRVKRHRPAPTPQEIGNKATVKARPGETPGEFGEFALDQTAVPPRRGRPAPAPEPPPDEYVDQDRLISFEELGKKREHFSDKNFQSGSPDANVADDMRRAYREEQIDLGNRVETGLGDRYGHLGELQQGAINAQESLGRGSDRSWLNPYRWWEGTVGQYTPNLKAHVKEGYAGALGAVSPKTVDRAALERGTQNAGFMGSTVARQAHDYVNDPAIDEQERAIRDYQESMRNLDYRHSR